MPGILKGFIVFALIVVGILLYSGVKIDRFNRCMEQIKEGGSIATADSCFGRRLALDSADRVYFMYAFKKDERISEVAVYQPVPGWPDIAVVGFDKMKNIVEKNRWSSP